MSPPTQSPDGAATNGLTLQQAIAEAHRCLLCHDAPCSKGCPGGTDPSKFIRQIRFYNFKGAARTVLRNNPLGGVCAYVCPTEETCRHACLRGEIDTPIDIDGLQRFAVEYGRSQGLTVLEKGQEKGARIAVIGAGPAGLAAAANLARFGYQVTVFEARAEAGGILRYGVPAHRLPLEALNADVREIQSLGVEIKTSHPIDRENATALLDQGYAAVFVAPGLWKAFELNLPGKDLQGVGTALEFLELARTDTQAAAQRVAGRNIAVIGGGAVAMDVAHTARELGAHRIYVLTLEGLNELPATAAELDQARQDHIIFKPQSRVVTITGQGGFVTGLQGCETEWAVKGKLTPDNARDVDGTEFQLRVGAVIQAIGQGPSEVVGRILSQAERKGRLVAADAVTLATSVDRVFAGGDIVRGAATVVKAVADGKRAADAIHKMLTGTEVTA